MNILLYCYYPFFDNHLAGGIQVWLRYLVDNINKDPNYNINVICPDSKLHKFAPNVNHSIIDIEQDNISPTDVYNSFKRLHEEESKADIIWVIDRSLPIKTTKPLLLSLNTLCYEKELLSFFQANWNVAVLPSNYSRNSLNGLCDNEKNLITIPYYIEPSFKKQYTTKEIVNTYNKYINYDENSKYILFPHRPDYYKGHFDAVDIMERLIEFDDSYRMLIPLPPNSKLSDVKNEKQVIEDVKKYIDKKGLHRYFIFHKWVSYSDLPLYYHGGYCTLFLSKLPETFGLTLLNSVVCSTPAISYGSGALSEVVPDCDMHRIANDKMCVVDIILSNKIKRNSEFSKEISEKYSLENVVSKYKIVFNYLKDSKNGKILF